MGHKDMLNRMKIGAAKDMARERPMKTVKEHIRSPSNQPTTRKPPTSAKGLNQGRERNPYGCN